MEFEYKKITYGNYKGTLDDFAKDASEFDTLKELKNVGLGCYLLTMELLSGGVLKLQIYDPESIKWIEE